VVVGLEAVGRGRDGRVDGQRVVGVGGAAHAGDAQEVHARPQPPQGQKDGVPRPEVIHQGRDLIVQAVQGQPQLAVGAVRRDGRESGGRGGAGGGEREPVVVGGLVDREVVVGVKPLQARQRQAVVVEVGGLGGGVVGLGGVRAGGGEAQGVV